jgi:prepilin-type N-terminal cleavage/methylation domain-containing protein
MMRFRRKSGRKGFTMIELMVVVVVVGVLAAIAIPIYAKYIKNSRVTEATGRMGEVITAAKSWALEHPDGAGDPVWPAAMAAGTTNGVIDLSVIALTNFDYAITTGGGAAKTTALAVTATGKNKMAGVTVVMTVPTIDLNAGPPVVSGL